MNNVFKRVCPNALHDRAAALRAARRALRSLSTCGTHFYTTMRGGGSPRLESEGRHRLAPALALGQGEGRGIKNNAYLEHHCHSRAR